MNSPRPWRRAAVWLACLGPFFFLSYGFANWVAAQRSYVPSIVFPWEHRIPFLAWTIVPYWSTDLFYAVSFFLCATRRELDNHGKRLLALQVISVLLFLAFPLRFTFAPPEVTGLLSTMFHALGSFDRPFNQAPSLHASITTILWSKYSEHMRGIPKFLVRCWLAISALSILTTYQHHFIDLPTGIWIGLFCLLLFPDVKAPRLEAARQPSPLLALVYAAGSFGLITVSCRTGGLAWLLVWPAGSLVIVAIAYASGSPRLFCTEDGRAGWPSRILLAPYRAVVWLNSRWWTRAEPPAQEVVAGVWMGRAPAPNQRGQLPFASVVNLAPELPIRCDGIALRNVPILDLTVPRSIDLDAIVQAIDSLKAHRPTLVCCALGYSRSAMAVAAWLLATEEVLSSDEAIMFLRSRRKRVVLGAGHRARLREWALGRRRLSHAS